MGLYIQLEGDWTSRESEFVQNESQALYGCLTFDSYCVVFMEKNRLGYQCKIRVASTQVSVRLEFRSSKLECLFEWLHKDLLHKVHESKIIEPKRSA